MKHISAFLLSLLVLLVIPVVTLASPPPPMTVVPSQSQVQWHKYERIAFLHYGMNTYTDKEWGTGSENPNIFQPGGQYDPDQWARELKEKGFELAILTAKHHDGFCLWPSQYTTHDVASSSWKDGQGDVVDDFAKACAKYGLKMGLYLSPWDMHEPTYGQGDAYNEFFKNQLRELLTNYGPIAEMWFDGAKGWGVDQDYDKESWFEIIRELQPDCIIWGYLGDVRWTGNEKGFGGEPCWSTSCSGPRCDELGLTADERSKLSQNGHPLGDMWYPPEADVSIRPGWFYHSSQDNQVKGLSKLIEIYKKSVGRNNVLLLNVPPNKQGLIHENDIGRLAEFNQWITTSFSQNKALGASIVTSAVRGNGDTYDGAKLIDENYDTYWALDDGETTGHFIIDFSKNVVFNTIMLKEYIPLGQRVESFAVDVWKNDAWVQVGNKTTIGYKRLMTISTQTANKVRVRITGALACPTINEVGIYMVGAVDPSQDPDKNFALEKNVVVSNQHSATYGGSKAVDGSEETRWATSDNTTSCSIEIDFWEPVTFNRVEVKQLQERVDTYQIEVFNGQEWQVAYEGEDLKQKESIIFGEVSGNKMRFKVLTRKGNLGPSFYEIGVYYDKPNVEKSNILLDRPSVVSDYHSAPYTGNKAIDGNENSRWATHDAVRECFIEVDLDGTKSFDNASIKELGQRIGDYEILYLKDEIWKLAYKGSNVGGETNVKFDLVLGEKVKLHILTTHGNLGPSIYEFKIMGY